MEIRKKTGVDLRERDLEILAALEKWGVLGLAQLDGLAFKKAAPVAERVRLFFNETDRRMYTLACYKRLRDLELAGFLRGHFYLNHSKVFSLTERGHRTLTEKGLAGLRGFKRGISEALLSHELAVNGVGLVLQHLLSLEVISEFDRALHSAAKDGRSSPTRYTIPDIWIRDMQHAKAVEVELTQKSEARYKKLWELYSRSMRYGQVILYLTGWPDGVDCIMNMTRKFEKQGGWRVYVASLRSFRESAGRCLFANNTYYEAPRHLRLAQPLPKAPAATATPAASAAGLPVAALEGSRA